MLCLSRVIVVHFHAVKEAVLTYSCISADRADPETLYSAVVLLLYSAAVVLVLAIARSLHWNCNFMC